VQGRHLGRGVPRRPAGHATSLKDHHRHPTLRHQQRRGEAGDATTDDDNISLMVTAQAGKSRR
jgi:hypothetical protein